MEGLIRQSALRFTKGKSQSVVRPGQGTARRNAWHAISRAADAPDSSSRIKPIKSGSSIGGYTEHKLQPEIRSRLYYKHGIAEGAGIKIQKHGVFLHYGVGRGYQRVGGTVVRTAKGPAVGGGRQPVDWFNKVLDAHTPQLAHDITEANADAAVNAMRLRIV